MTRSTTEAWHAKGFRPDGKGGLVRMSPEEWNAKHGPIVSSAPGPDWSRDGICIRLPHPPKELRTNSRAHYHAKARAVKAYRALACAEARAVCGANPPRWEMATVAIEWRARGVRHPDPDGVVGSMKAALDGLQDAGVVANDRGLWPERPIILTKQPWSEVVLTVRQDPILPKQPK